MLLIHDSPLASRHRMVMTYGTGVRSLLVSSNMKIRRVLVNMDRKKEVKVSCQVACCLEHASKHQTL